MNWIVLNTEEQLETLIKNSHDKPQVVFKHSTRCSISSVVKKRLEKSNPPGHIEFYFLDLIAHRSLSNKISKDLSISHESPQVLLIQNGICKFDESHLVIHMDDILSNIA